MKVERLTFWRKENPRHWFREIRARSYDEGLQKLAEALKDPNVESAIYEAPPFPMPPDHHARELLVAKDITRILSHFPEYELCEERNAIVVENPKAKWHVDYQGDSHHCGCLVCVRNYEGRPLEFKHLQRPLKTGTIAINKVRRVQQAWHRTPVGNKPRYTVTAVFTKKKPLVLL